MRGAESSRGEEDPAAARQTAVGRWAIALVAAVTVASSCGDGVADVAPSPEVRIEASCAGLACDFDVATIDTPQVTAWQWSFGDGAESTSQNPSHLYAELGTFEVALMVTAEDGVRAVHTDRVELVEPADPVAASLVELGYRASQPGRYVTRWDHPDPGITLAIEDGWWATDTLTVVTVGTFAALERAVCDPVLRIMAPQGWYDPAVGGMVPAADVTRALEADPRLTIEQITTVGVGGYPATKVDVALRRDELEISRRWCGDRRYEAIALGAADPTDPRYRWVWMPAAPRLVFWTLDVAGTEMVLAASMQDDDPDALDSIEAIVASIEFHPAREPELSRTLRTEFGDIAIYSGTSPVHALTEWAVSRFVAAGIGSPNVSSATFSADVACHERGYSGGFAQAGAVGADVFLCFGEERPVSLAASTILHEFAHAWMAGRIDDATRDAFAVLLGLAAWSPDGGSASKSGPEYAADVIAWGLQVDAELPLRLGGRSCDTLAGAFELLTGTRPLSDPAACGG